MLTSRTPAETAVTFSVAIAWADCIAPLGAGFRHRCVFVVSSHEAATRIARGEELQLKSRGGGGVVKVTWAKGVQEGVTAEEEVVMAATHQQSLRTRHG